MTGRANGKTRESIQTGEWHDEGSSCWTRRMRRKHDEAWFIEVRQRETVCLV